MCSRYLTIEAEKQLDLFMVSGHELIESICLNLEPGQYHLGEHQLLMQMKNPQNEPNELLKSH